MAALPLSIVQMDTLKRNRAKRLARLTTNTLLIIVNGVEQNENR